MASRRALEHGDHRTGAAQAERALALAEHGDMPPALVEALTLLTHHRLALGCAAEALASAERACAEIQTRGQAEAECEAWSLRAAACSEAGFDEEALQDAHRAFELACTHKLAGPRLHALALMGGLHGRLGDVEGAEALLLQTLSRAHERQDTGARFLALNHLVAVLLQAHALHSLRGDADARQATARRLLHQARHALNLASHEPSRLHRAVLRSQAAAGLLANGLLDEALPLLADCQAQARAEGFRALELKACTGLLQGLSQAGRAEEARHAAAQLQALLAQGGPRRHQPPAEQEAAAMLAALAPQVGREHSPAQLQRAVLQVRARHGTCPPALQAALQDHLELVMGTLDTLHLADLPWALRPALQPDAAPAEALPAA